MRILYVASDQVVPGRTGGSVHVLEVARGLAARGHEVHVVIHRQDGSPDREEREGVHWHRVEWRPSHRMFRFRARAAVERIAAEMSPHAVMERYYNFGGEGIGVAAARGIPSLLEVNSPVVDHPGSFKGMLDALAVVRPLRRARDQMCRQAAALVAPLAAIVPEFARAKTETVTWGANIEAFHPGRRSTAVRDDLGVPSGAFVVLFIGSFRRWHGVRVFEAAARQLASRGDIFFLLVGGSKTGEGRGYRGRSLGALPYEHMSDVVAAADVGIAPYHTSRLRQLRLGFFWSPLKIFEYMASGLPTVTIPRFPLTEIVREGVEGLYFREADPQDLARVITRLADDPLSASAMGRRARERVVDRYSWARHCEELERILLRITTAKGGAGRLPR